MLRLFTALLALTAVFAIAVPAQSYAADCKGGVEVSGALDTNGNPSDNCIGSSTKNPIYDLIAKVIQYATGILGLLMVLMIVISGLQYVMSGGSPERTKSAKERLEHVMVGFVAYILMYGVLYVILPPDMRPFG